MASTATAQQRRPMQRETATERDWGIPVDPRVEPRPSPIYKNWDPRLVLWLLMIGALGGGLIGALTLAVAVVDIGR